MNVSQINLNICPAPGPRVLGSYRRVPRPGMLWAEETGIKQNKWQHNAQKPQLGAKPNIPLKRKCWKKLKKDFGSTRGARWRGSLYVLFCFCERVCVRIVRQTKWRQ